MGKFDNQIAFVLESLAKQDVRNKFVPENMDLTYDMALEHVIFAVFDYRAVEVQMWPQEEDYSVLEVELTRVLDNGVGLSHRLRFCDQNIECCKDRIIASIAALEAMDNSVVIYGTGAAGQSLPFEE